MRITWISLLLALYSLTVKSQLIINEILAANTTSHYETDFYNFPDYIEIYNQGSSPVNLFFHYISDDKDNLQKWQLPDYTLGANQYYIIYCDKKSIGRHTNFGLDADGETIYLSNSSGPIIDHVKFNQQYPDISYGRGPVDTYRWYYCPVPTPGAANIVSVSIEQDAKVQYSLPAGRLGATKPLNLTGSIVKYTLDGKVPAVNSTTYSQTININKTMVVKTKNYDDYFLPGEIYANTYFFNEHIFTLPVLSISYNHEYFYNNTIGIYVEGTNGIAGNCYGSANWNQNWERAAYMEYFDEDGIKQISQPIGVKVAGGCSRSFTNQKSLSLYARSKYGNSDFDYPFFKEKPYIVKSKSLLLRNSGNDVNTTQLRDAFLQALIKGSIDIDCQAYQPVITYLNGKYWGIMNLREKTNEDYFFGNYALSDDSVDFLEGKHRPGTSSNYTAIRGKTADYDEIVSFISSNSLISDSNYSFIASRLDLQEYLNYSAYQIYIANTDWPGNNLKFWKTSENGKWRWLLYDTDFGFGATSYDHQTIEFATEPNGPNWPNPPWATLLFRKMMENQGFRKEFANTILTLRNTVFHPEWCNFLLDSLSSGINYEITYHKSKWGGSKNDWMYSLNKLKSFAAARYDFMQGYIASYFNFIGDEVIVSVTNPDIEKGGVVINESVIRNYPFTMNTYKELGLSLKAFPAKGYKFKHWNHAPQINTKYLIESGSEWSYLDEASGYPEGWTGIEFHDSLWKKGFAKLGYGDGNEVTVISYGSDKGNKIPSALFRKKFTLDDTSGLDEIKLSVSIDDGAVVYLNGQEVHRYNMPSGAISFSTYAVTPIEISQSQAIIDRSILNTGENILACEVHQANATSSDLGYDLSLSYTYTEQSDTGIYSYSSVLKSDTGYNIAIEPVFEPIQPVEGIYLNEVAAISSSFIDEYGENSGFVELINNTAEDKMLYSYFISDKNYNLTRYALPDSTVIPAGGFLIIYLDGEARQGKYHTLFKADPDGESLYLSQKIGDEIIIRDSVNFEYLADNHSYGRYIDGTGEWQYMVNMTPGAPNDASRLVNQSEFTEITESIITYPNPNQGTLYIHIDIPNADAQNFSAEVTDLSGKIVLSRTRLENNNDYLNLTGLYNGFYLVKIYNGNTLRKTDKVIVQK